VARTELRNLFELTGDRSELTQLLQSARAAKFRSSGDFFEHFKAHSAWLATLPACLMMGVSDVRQQVSRKHALGFEARAHRHGQAAVNWSTVRTITALNNLTPDRCRYLGAVPSWIKPKLLAKELGCELLWVSIWPRLMWDALQEWPGIIDLAAAHVPEIQVCLSAYLAKHKVSPSPFALIMEFLHTVPAKLCLARAARAVINCGCDQGGTEKADDSWQVDVGGGGAPLGQGSPDAIDSVSGRGPVRKRPAQCSGVGLKARRARRTVL